MSTQRLVWSRGRRQHGLSLVELMVALTIGLFLTAGIIQLFIGTNQTYRFNESMARLQENGRFALEILSRDLRMAGFVGCVKPNNPSVVHNIVDPESDGRFDPGKIVMGFDDSDAGTTINGLSVVAGSDYFTFITSGPSGRLIEEKVSNANAKLENNAADWKAGDVLIVSDCQDINIFRATNVSQGVNNITIAHAQNGNTDNRLSKTYKQGADVMAFQRKTFFVALNPNTNSPSLWRQINSGNPQEIIERVGDMQVTYRLSNNDNYIDASPGMQNVVALRINFRLESAQDNIASAPMTLSYNDSTFTATDRRFYQIYSTTVALRNRLP
jgi:type IV pilus assembly protein PilW